MLCNQQLGLIVFHLWCNIAHWGMGLCPLRTEYSMPNSGSTHLIIVVAAVAVIRIVLVVCIHCFGHQRARRAAATAAIPRRCCRRL